MSEIKLREDYIKLGQALKAAGSVGSGVDAKFVIQDGRVKVNGETEYQRGIYQTWPGIKSSRTGWFRCGCKTGHPGRTCKSQWRNGSSERKETL